MTPPLTQGTIEHIITLFEETLRPQVIEQLMQECGGNLPFCENATPESSERIRFAVLKLSEGDMTKFQTALRVAKEDWRDVLVAAGFGHSVLEHTRWNPREVSSFFRK